jgi:hypothetical protein
VIHDFAVLRVDPTTNEVVGLEFEHFVKAAVYELPVLFVVTQWLDIPKKDVARMRRRLEKENQLPHMDNRASLKRELLGAIQEQLNTGSGQAVPRLQTAQ